MMQPFHGNAGEWNNLITKLPGAHLLQTREWSQVKSRFGWEPMPYIWSKKSEKSGSSGESVSSDLAAAAMVLKRRIPLSGFAARLNILYIPKGPLMDWSDVPLRNRVLDDLQSFAKKQSAIFLKIDPDVVLGTGIQERNPTSPDDRLDNHQENSGQAVMSALAHRGWMFSSDQIQFRNTVIIDLTPSEDELLAGMKQKTRYNVRLAGKRGVTVRVGNAVDFPMLYKMYAETSLRDGFVIRAEAYYRTVWQTFMDANSPTCEPLIAEVAGEPVAAIFVFYFAGRAYYLYGMSRETQREKMPNYLLQWEAIRRARASGCQLYDLWGAPDDFNENDAMWGVFRFKEGLGGQVVRTLGAWDYTPRRLWYKMYMEVIPRVLDVMRSRGKSRTRQQTGT